MAASLAARNVWVHLPKRSCVRLFQETLAAEAHEQLATFWRQKGDDLRHGSAQAPRRQRTHPAVLRTWQAVPAFGKPAGSTACRAKSLASSPTGTCLLNTLLHPMICVNTVHVPAVVIIRLDNRTAFIVVVLVVFVVVLVNGSCLCMLRRIIPTMVRCSMVFVLLMTPSYSF